MKHCVLIICIVSITLQLYAQKPETIPMYAKEKKEMAWYKQQIELWQKEVNAHPQSETAWYNLYSANRIQTMHDNEDKSTPEVKEERLKQIVNSMGKELPNSYTYNFCMWQLGGNNMDYFHYLQKAIRIDSNRTEHIDYMINVGEIECDMSIRDQYALKKMKANMVSNGMLYYNYNQIIGLEPNAIILTSGDNDTYPSWVLQAMGIRKDVKVLNLYLLHIEKYREKVFKELDIPALDLKETNQKEFFKTQIVEIVKHMHKNKQNRPVYIALTSMTCNDYVVDIEDDLYLIGLSYKYDTASFDNMAVLKKNMEKNYALDYLDKPFYNDISVEWVKYINENYIIPMLKLYEHYKAAGDVQRQNWIKEKLLLIVKNTAQEKKVISFMD